ncbi:MAG: urate hydroxylase PuuD [Amphritea sp.]
MDMPLFDILMRCFHIAFALIWVGHNYASVVQNPHFRPFNAETSEDARTAALETRMQREHGTFRYAAIVVWVSGMGMLWYRGWLEDVLTLSGPYAVIGIGAWIGTLMMLNLWLIMWPHQKKVLGFTPAPLEERVRCSRITFLSSRTNTILSMPLLFFMAAGSHNPQLFM